MNRSEFLGVFTGKLTSLKREEFLGFPFNFEPKGDFLFLIPIIIPLDDPCIKGNGVRFSN